MYLVIQVALCCLALTQLQPVSTLNALCPKRCVCIRRAVRCIHMKLDTVPFVPHDTNTLDLRFNNIHRIPAGSFANLNHLTTLLLSNNHLTVLENDTFKGLKRLRLLYLYKNNIHSIEDGAFKGLESLQQLYLHDNKIRSFNVDVLSNLSSLQRLFMHNNEIKRLPRGAFEDMPKLQRLRLDSNFLVCDCSLIWLLKLLNKHRKARSSFQVAANCDTPESMGGMSLTSLTENDLHCESPKILKEPEDIQISFGGMAIFDCEVRGDPQPDVIWMHDSKEISLLTNHYELLDNGSLKINDPVMSDNGYFECIAKNSIGEATSKPAKMTILQDNQFDSYAEEEIQFVITPKDDRINEGTDALILNCQASGQPKPHITWYHNDERILLSPHVKVEHNGSLIINNVVASDAGKYTCEAHNIYETIHAMADVEVFSSSELTQRSIIARLGSKVILRCFENAVPILQAKWYKNGEVLLPTPKLYFRNDGTELELTNVDESQKGSYLCKAVSSERIIENIINLDIKDEGKAPVFVFKPYDIEAFPGSYIELPCKTEGNPVPTIEWKKEGTVIQRTLHEKVSAIGSLHIFNLTVRDNGRYECSAVNEHGRISGSAFLTVKVSNSADFTNDDFIRLAFSQAASDVDEAINKTIDTLFSSKKSYVDFGELFRASRFPNEPAREIARAAEIYERTLVNIRNNINAGKKVNTTDAFHYEAILSPKQLDLIAKLSGCMLHQKTKKCTDLCFHKKYRSIDGTCNNFKNPMYGASLTGFHRLMQPIYENGFSQPVGWTKNIPYNGFVLPSSRLVSTRMIATEVITPDNTITHMVMQWGQFLDHDLDHAIPSVSSQSWDGIDCKKSCEYAAPCFPIDVPPRDPRVNNRRCIDFIRSSSICGSGMTSVIFGKIQPREQINQLTSFIDASQVYGFSEDLSNDLRDFTKADGTMRKGIVFPGNKPLLPYAGNQGVDCRRDPLESNINCFVAGDIRANEQVGLLAMHTLWFREHNRLATELKNINPHWDGEKLFQEARKIVGAQMQHITFTSWLPIILGRNGMTALGKYQQYNASINPSISNVFATAALRFGHSLINPILHRLDKNFEPIPQGHLPLHKAFFAPWRVVDEGGIDPLLRGLFAVSAKLKTPSQNLNTELTEKLFYNAHAVALDLAAMNIQRSRDHAIPPYLEWRKFCNMPAVNSFEDLRYEISDRDVRNKLEQLYGTPKNIDVWVGGILEDQLPDAKVGPLFQCLLIEQFKRLREGDRLWYESPTTFHPDQLREIKRVTLSRVLCDNSDNITEVSNNVFKLPTLQGGMKICKSIPSIDLSHWADCGECEHGNSESNILRLKRHVQENNANTIDEVHKEIKYLHDKILELEKKMTTLEKQSHLP